MNDCNLDGNGDKGVGETPAGIELVFVNEIPAAVMLPWARVLFPCSEEE